MTYIYSAISFKIKDNHWFLSFILALLLLTSGNISAQNYWMQKGGGSGADEGYSISSDGSNKARLLQKQGQMRATVFRRMAAITPILQDILQAPLPSVHLI